MRIAALGYYGYGNAGDERILQVIRKACAPHTVHPIQLPFPSDEDSLDRLRLYDFLLVGGGGIVIDGLPQPFSTAQEWCRSLDVPMGFLGVGIDRLASGDRPALEALLEVAEFFVVRDDASAAIIKDQRIRTAPDLTYAFPLEARSSPTTLTTDAHCGVSLRHAPGQARAWAEACAALPYQIQPYIMSEQCVFGERWAMTPLGPSKAVPFSAELLSSLDLVIAMTFHSIVFAIQTGIPPIAIGASEKIKRQMQAIGLERYLLPLDGQADLHRCCEAALADAANIQQVLADHTRRSAAATQAMLAEVRDAIEASQAHRRSSRALRSLQSVNVVLLPSPSGEFLDTTAGSTPQPGLVGGAEPDVREEGDWPETSIWDGAAQGETGKDTEPAGACQLLVSAGLRLTDDCIQSLVACLERHPEATWVSAAVHLTRDGHIEYTRQPAAGPAGRLQPGEWPTLLLRRSRPGSWRNGRQDGPATRYSEPELRRRDGRVVNHGLAFAEVPASFIGYLMAIHAMAFEDANGAQAELAASSPRWIAEDQGLLADASSLLEARAGLARPDDPLAFVQRCEAVFGAIDPRYKTVTRAAQARILMGQAYTAFAEGRWRVCIARLLQASRLEPRWLLRRGSVAMLVRATGGMVLARLNLAGERPR